MSQVPIFSITGPVAQGMFSSVDSAALGDGQFPLLQNLRWTGVPLEARGGLAAFRVTTGLASGTVVGAFYDNVAGNYLAVKVGSSVRLYKWNVSSWADINVANRLGNVDRVYFASFSLPDPGVFVGISNTASTLSYLVVQDGTSNPLIVPVGVGTFTATSVSSISAPNISMLRARPYTFANLPVPTTTTFTNSSTSTTGTNTTYSVGTTTIGNCVQINFTMTTAAGQSVAFPFVAGFGTTQPSQLQIVFNGRSDIWSQVAIEIGDSTTWYTIHAPNITRAQTVGVGDRFTAALFDCASVSTDVPTSATTSNWVSFPAISATRMRFTWASTSAPPAAFNIQVYAACFSENVPFGTQFGVSFYNESTTAESAGVIAANQAPPSLARSGGTPIPGVTLAANTIAKYGYTIQWRSNAADQRALIYARSGDTYYLLNRNPAFTGAAGVMGFSNISSIEFGRWTMPSAGTIAIPRAGDMLLTGDRLFVASVENTGAAQRQNAVRFSEKSMPNRFVVASEITQGQVQPRTGGIAVFANETVTKIMPLSGQLYGGEGCMVWTELGLYQLSGVDPIQLSRPSAIAPYGTTSPGSVTRFRNTVLWLSPDRQLLSLGNDLGDISARAIEDKLKGIPASRLPFVEATVFNERFYFAYTPSGGSVNNRILVYDARTQGWSDDLIASNASVGKWAPFLVNNEDRLIGVDPSGWSFEYDVLPSTGDVDASNTNTIKPTIKVTSRTISNAFLNELRLGDVTIVADDQGSGVTWTTEYIERKTGAVATGTINMNGSGSYVWRLNRGDATNKRVGQIGLGVQLSITGQATPGSKIYAIAVEAEPQKQNGADRE